MPTALVGSPVISTNTTKVWPVATVALALTINRPVPEVTTAACCDGDMPLLSMVTVAVGAVLPMIAAICAALRSEVMVKVPVTASTAPGALPTAAS